jgi:hypothetical protein
MLPPLLTHRSSRWKHLRVRIVFGLLLMLLASTCTHRPRYATEAEAALYCVEREGCDGLSVADGVTLTPAEECWVRVLRDRCDIYDRCILKCLLAGEARNIAGGCWHVCGYIIVKLRSGFVFCPSSPTPGAEECRGLPDEVSE